jgi:hypothetical protein
MFVKHYFQSNIINHIKTHALYQFLASPFSLSVKALSRMRQPTSMRHAEHLKSFDCFTKEKAQIKTDAQ